MRRGAAYALGSVIAHIPDKKQAWVDLHRLTSDTYSDVRGRVASGLVSAFSHVPDKKQAWNDLIKLTTDIDINVRVAANHSSGRVSIFRASQAENEYIFRLSLPQPAASNRSFWGNDKTHSQAKYGWLNSGWEVSSVDMKKQIVVFQRIKGRKMPTEISNAAEFENEEN